MKAKTVNFVDRCVVGFTIFYLNIKQTRPKISIIFKSTTRIAVIIARLSQDDLLTAIEITINQTMLTEMNIKTERKILLTFHI